MPRHREIEIPPALSAPELYRTCDGCGSLVRDEEKCGDCAQWRALYGRKDWKLLRISKMADSPLCELCERKGEVSVATECHHLVPFMSGETAAEKLELFFGWDNLAAVCKTCHEEAHIRKRRYPRE